jgi:hypothetical protein
LNFVDSNLILLIFYARSDRAGRVTARSDVHRFIATRCGQRPLRSGTSKKELQNGSEEKGEEEVEEEGLTFSIPCATISSAHVS